ncbi:MAG: replication factor C small subunit [Candidatus Aenigmarchaeota archaeon]|nr:replication factor C small subunit [Candidatus Aenigmarchaeota archaeon]
MLEEIWTEKYRPRLLKDVVGQEEITKRLESFVKNRTLPHCLFAGPAGVGKTTCALAIAHELFGQNWRSNFLELNASDERGIDTVRVKIKDFARTMPLAGMFKIVYLDEADSLTKDAQHALRRTMENYSAACRFILACNYSSRIILPIQSRTAVFRFSPLRQEDIAGFLKGIASAEGLAVDEAAYRSMVYLSEGDMRRAVNILQTAATMDGSITEEVVYAVTNRADPKEVLTMLEKSLAGDFKASRNQLLKLLYERGLAGEDIIKEIYSQTFSLNIEDEKKLAIIEKIGEYEFRLTEGSNPQIQLEALLAQITLVGKK